MIVEQLFTRQLEIKLPTCHCCQSLTRDFSVIEENAIYYAAAWLYYTKGDQKYNNMDNRKPKGYFN